jgi:hypothetical protein
MLIVRESALWLNSYRQDTLLRPLGTLDEVFFGWDVREVVADAYPVNEFGYTHSLSCSDVYCGLGEMDGFS